MGQKKNTSWRKAKNIFKIHIILSNTFRSKFYIIKSKCRSGVIKLVAYLSEITSVRNYTKPKKPVSYNKPFSYPFKTKVAFKHRDMLNNTQICHRILKTEFHCKAVVELAAMYKKIQANIS